MDPLDGNLGQNEPAGGKEKSAAEILSLLAEKGLEADEEEIKGILMLLEEDSAEQPDSSKSKESEQKLLNKINSTEGAWYLLPFELVQLGETDEADSRRILGQGCIRLLYDSEKSLKQMNLECRYNNLEYLFKLSYEGKKITNTTFTVINASEADVFTLNPDKEVENLKKRFMAAGINPGKIEWAEKEELEGNASGLESFVTFGGQV